MFGRPASSVPVIARRRRLQASYEVLGGLPAPPPHTFSEKLERCIAVMHPRDRAPMTLEEVSAGMAGQGVVCSVARLEQLLAGASGAPAPGEVEALAAVFHVPARFFVGTDEEVYDVHVQMALVEAARTDPEVWGRLQRLVEDSSTPEG